MNGHDKAAGLDLTQWVGREETRTDRLDQRIVQALAATLDLEPEALIEGAELPPLWHWVYFTPCARRRDIGTDGHPQRGGFLPPVDLPNRMWAGGRLQFEQPLRVGEAVTRQSRIARCERKDGRHGELVFVTVEHRVCGERGLALIEEQDIVYRQPTPKGAALSGATVEGSAQFRERIHPDPVLLFRYSALTFNAHRIHYDQPYASHEEGYAGLVVQGPLAATLLLETFRARHPEKRVRCFEFRAVGPLFDTPDFEMCGQLQGPDSAALWAECQGRLTMKAHVFFN